MRLLSAALLSIATSITVFPSGLYAQEKAASGQIIIRAETQNISKGSGDYFTGDVKIRIMFPDNASAPYSGGEVTFAAGARSHWHTHPTGQHLIVTSGRGLTGTADGKIEQINAGDAVWCPPDIKHWHGAAPDSEMTHIAITGVADGKNVDWMEPVTDQQYNGK
ncbi:cupin domain-containing protein [Microvirga sp. W0021]|uniref:Cupin domain-containing protein n=1 Tax=Hohaiivirga grylli TaxID=3133970 RepID=A0ABV0BFW5_9HYPH